VLVTRDGASKTQPRGILGAAPDIAKLGVTIMSDVEAVSFIRHEVARRDHYAPILAKRFGNAVPDWVGKD
jgi:hypothetical protein